MLITPCIALLTVLAVSPSNTLTDQAKKPTPKQKPAAGAVQMPGDNGKLLTQYSLGKKGEELVFTLEKAEFASRAITSDGPFYAGDDQRLLMLTYAVQNPGKSDRFFFNQSFSFTVVSPDDENFVADGIHKGGWQGYHPDRRDLLSLQLKPAQKVRALAIITIHPKGPVNKLIVQRGQGTPVLRYDLKEKVKAMTGSFAVADSLDIQSIGLAAPIVPFDLGPFDIAVEKVEDIVDPVTIASLGLGSSAPEAGQKLIVATMTVKNVSMSQQGMQPSILDAKMDDEDGDSLKWAAMAKMSSGDQVNAILDPGQQIRFRNMFIAPMAAKPAKMLLKDYYSGRKVMVVLAVP